MTDLEGCAPLAPLSVFFFIFVSCVSSAAVAISPAMYGPCHAHSPCHACPLPCIPPAMHAPYHACSLPCMPPAMHGPCHAYLPCHAHPTSMLVPCHACPPPMDRMTDACENTTFPQLLLWKVIIGQRSLWHPSK